MKINKSNCKHNLRRRVYIIYHDAVITADIGEGVPGGQLWRRAHDAGGGRAASAVAPLVPGAAAGTRAAHRAHRDVQQRPLVGQVHT